MSKQFLYINQEWGNLASLNIYGDAVAAGLYKISWRELIFEILGEDPDDEGLENLLEEEYGLALNQLDANVPEDIVDTHYSSVAFRYENDTGAEAKAFCLIRDLALFEMDLEGNGSWSGVELCQTTANGPRKTVYVADESGAKWLQEQFKKYSLDIEVCFV